MLSIFNHREFRGANPGAERRRAQACAQVANLFSRAKLIGPAAALKLLRNYKCKFLGKIQRKCFSYFSVHRDGRLAKCGFTRQKPAMAESRRRSFRLDPHFSAAFPAFSS